MSAFLCVILLASSMAERPTGDNVPATVDARADRIWNAAGVVTLGTVVAGAGAGAIAYIGYNTVNSNLVGEAYTVANIVVTISSAAFLFGVPIGMLALFADGLPAWGPWLGGATAAFGTLVGLVTGAWLANAYIFWVARQTGNDCIGCGPEAVAGIALPIGLAFVVGSSLGIATTTLATLSE